MFGHLNHKVMEMLLGNYLAQKEEIFLLTHNDTGVIEKAPKKVFYFH